MTYQPHPLRIRLSRKKGYRKPAGAVVVSRPSKWGNQFTVAECGSREAAVQRYRNFVMQTAWPELRASIVAELRGKQLACWCPLDQPCHADVLAALANEPSANA